MSEVPLYQYIQRIMAQTQHRYGGVGFRYYVYVKLVEVSMDNDSYDLCILY